jgi:hypothetical protein
MPLSDLEATIFEIAVELLLVERENQYPSLLYGQAVGRQRHRLVIAKSVNNFLNVS